MRNSAGNPRRRRTRQNTSDCLRQVSSTGSSRYAVRIALSSVAGRVFGAYTRRRGVSDVAFRTSSNGLLRRATSTPHATTSTSVNSLTARTPRLRSTVNDRSIALNDRRPYGQKKGGPRWPALMASRRLPATSVPCQRSALRQTAMSESSHDRSLQGATAGRHNSSSRNRFACFATSGMVSNWTSL